MLKKEVQMETELIFFQLQEYRGNPHQNEFGIVILKKHSHPYVGSYRHRAGMKWSCKHPKAGNGILKYFSKSGFLSCENDTQTSLINVVSLRPVPIYLCLLDFIRGTMKETMADLRLIAGPLSSPPRRLGATFGIAAEWRVCLFQLSPPDRPKKWGWRLPRQWLICIVPPWRIYATHTPQLRVFNLLLHL